MRFRTTLVLGGRTATGMTVPAEVVESFGQGRKQGRKQGKKQRRLEKILAALVSSSDG
ncbi:hypothetical protein [Dactylosporangium sp. NPDC050588]|uniref:hypothetical protein n=1 Tax=Dactylosporangium sp. NPDC050588 TaxID=3157211 RepID=UPI0034090C1E